MELINKYRNIIGVALIVAATAGIIYASYIRGRVTPEFMEYAAFVGAVEEGRVDSATIGEGAMIYFTLAADEASENAISFTTNNPRREDFKEFLLINGVSVMESSHSDFNFFQIGFTIALVAGVLLFVQRKSSAVRAAGGLNPVMVSARESEKMCGFDDIAGNLEAKESV